MSCALCGDGPRHVVRLRSGVLRMLRVCAVCAHDNLKRALAQWDAEAEIDALYTDLGGES